MTINSTAAILLAFLVVAAEKKGVNRASLNGTIQNDILKEYIARGTYIYPPKPSMRIITDLFEFCSASQYLATIFEKQDPQPFRKLHSPWQTELLMFNPQLIKGWM